MKYQKNSGFHPSRLIFQNQPSPENIRVSEEENLRLVSEAVKESYGERLKMKQDIDTMLKPVETERAAHQQFIAEMHAKLEASPGQTLREEFQCLGEKILIVMSPSGQYQEYLNSQPINFLNWAINKKKNSPSESNA
ncbi:hypothetical protein IT412_03420 [Candidatus Peregrinibacteria bacterium]|nr:hypothetical protein [Candidatus Peregrinibacteria bacterium]